jgi:hypothetical protein
MKETQLEPCTANTLVQPLIERPGPLYPVHLVVILVQVLEHIFQTHGARRSLAKPLLNTRRVIPVKARQRQDQLFLLVRAHADLARLLQHGTTGEYGAGGKSMHDALDSH